ncbi:hypothetical protein SAMN05444161_3377 [Rhizobiales bacterium GAS191]|nr:hypothetical protein SAMN05519103_02497 [Rhizobiales bacterium GAS113]SED51745.1 hypothetical protein SAMN05444161_3377 [Rhizobiales bacterium GAS191]
MNRHAAPVQTGYKGSGDSHTFTPPPMLQERGSF